MLLGEVASRLAGNDLRTVVGHGEVVQTILEQAEKPECDLIVMATHGHHLLIRGVLGCVSEGIWRGGPIPVLTTDRERGGTLIDSARSSGLALFVKQAPELEGEARGPGANDSRHDGSERH